MKRLLYFSFFSILLSNCSSEKVAKNKVLHPNKLMTQTFTIDPSKDTILYGKDRTELHISKNTFAGESPIQIELKEAIQLEDIVLANLHTITEDNEVLSSNGMIHLVAKDVNGKELQLEKDQSIKVVFSNAGMREGLKVFQGVNQDGEIRWRESGELENINVLDSLAIGKELFEQNCATCHSSNLRTGATGPALGNVHLFRERQWLRDFTRNSQKMITDGDTLALCLWQDWKPTVMNSFDTLSDRQIDLIYEYIANESILQRIDTTEIRYITECIVNQSPVEIDNNVSNHFNLLIDTSATITLEPWPDLFNTISNNLRTKEIGWLNIDRLLKDRRSEPRIFCIKLNTSAFDYVYSGIVLLNDKSFIQTVLHERDMLYFSGNPRDRRVSLPIGESAIIIAAAQDGEQYFFGYKEITYGDNEIEEIELKESSEEEIEEIIRRIL